MGTHRAYRERNFEFSQRLLTLRTRVGLTQSALASQLGLHRRSVQNWEAAESYPKADTLQRLIEVLAGHGAFTYGRAHEEAAALWALAARHGPQALGAFDASWFAGMLAEAPSAPLSQGPQYSSEPPEQNDPAHTRVIIDWGEAVAPAALYGRDAELATLSEWVADDRCRVVTLVGLGGIGKSSLAVSFAHQIAAQFDLVLFRSLQNGPTLAELLDGTIRAISAQQSDLPKRSADKIDLLVQLLRERRCLLILDNFESLLEHGALASTYRTGYAEYGTLIEALGTRSHESCVLLTSREKLAELTLLEGRAGPVRSLPLAGLSQQACQLVLAAKDIVATPEVVGTLAQQYGGNPLALLLVAEPLRELFGGDIAAFLAAGDTFFNGVGTLLQQQLARSTPVEQALVYALAIAREPVPIDTLLGTVATLVPQHDGLVALESLRRRLLIERALDGLAFTLQPVILEFVTDWIVGVVEGEIAAAQPRLLLGHALVAAGAKDDVRRSQEHLLAAPLLQRLRLACGGERAVEQRLLDLLDPWRGQPPRVQGYGPGNVVNLLRLLRGNLQGLDLRRLSIRHAYLQGIELHDASLAGAELHESVLTEHFDAIKAVAVSENGQLWAASSRRGEVRVWSAGGQTLQRLWRAHSDMVWALALSPDGTTLASGSWDSTIKLWEVASGALRWSGGHTGHVNRVAFAPDGGRLASSGNDATVRIWDAHTGALLQTLPHPKPAVAITWARDGCTFASGDVAGVVRIWEVALGETAVCLQTLHAHSSWVSGLAFAPDGRSLASVSWDSSVKLWDVASGQVRQTLLGHTDRVLRTVWSRDGRTLATSARDTTLRLWDTEQATCRAILRGHSGATSGLAMTADSRLLLSGGEDGTLRVWDVASGQCLRVVQGYAPFPYVVDWSPDGQRLVSGSTNTLVTIWDVAQAAPLEVLRGHGGLVCGVGWSANGQWLASSEWDNAIRLWAPASGACLRVIRHPTDPGNCFYDLAWSPDGRRLASGTNRHGVQIFDAAADSHDWQGRTFPTIIRHVAWSPRGDWLAGGGDDGTVYVWQPDGDAPPLPLAGQYGAVNSLVWSPSGAGLAWGAAGGAGGALLVWNGERVSAPLQHASVVSAVAWGAATGLVVSGDGDGTLRCWDLERGQIIWLREAHDGSVRWLRRCPDGARLASCGDDGAIRIWDLHTGEAVQTLRPDRPCERLDITGLSGITEAQRRSLIALGAVERLEEPVVARSAPALPSNAAVPGPHPSVPKGLPTQSSTFVGHGEELARIATLLRDPACRLLTLLGPGGIGKTRLAIEVAAAQAYAFSDGVAFVSLAATDAPGQLVDALSATLGLAVVGQPNDAHTLLAYLHTREMLLVLDTFEHLLDGVDFLTMLLAQAPHITLLITSRERLNIGAEWLFDVEGLDYPPESAPGAAQAAPDLAAYSAVQLFVQRAAQLMPLFAPSEADLATIGRICRHVGGMPLAIELAAAGVRTLPIEEIERRIRANLHVPSATHGEMPTRHRSLRAVFDHSWHLLDEREQRLLSSLAVFRGGWTLEAAEQVAGATFANLAALADKSLVRIHHQQQRAATSHSTSAPAAPRFSMLEPIREEALRRQVFSDTGQALRRVHATYYLAFAEQASEQWDGPAAEVRIAQLDDEWENMRAALQWARSGGDSALGLRLGVALRKFWQRRGAYHEGRVWLEALLALEHDPTDTALAKTRMRALHAAGWLAADQHDFARSAQLLEQSVVLRRALGETERDGHLLLNAARRARAEGHYQQAVTLFEDALAHHRATGDRGSASSGGLGQSLYDLALVRREQGDFTAAVALLEEGLALHRAIGEGEGEVIGLLGLGDVARDRGDAEVARARSEQSLALARKIQVHWAIGFALNNLALAALMEGDLHRASALLEECVALFRGMQADASLAEVLITQGKLLRAHGDTTAAYATLTEALRLALALGPRLMVAAALEELAIVAATQGHAILAVQSLALSSALRAQMATPIRPVDRAAVERALATAQAALSPADFTATWRATETLSPELFIHAILTDGIPATMPVVAHPASSSAPSR